MYLQKRPLSTLAKIQIPSLIRGFLLLQLHHVMLHFQFTICSNMGMIPTPMMSCVHGVLVNFSQRN